MSVMALYPPSSNEGSALPLYSGHAPSFRDAIEYSADGFKHMSSAGMIHLGYGVAFLEEMHRRSSYSHCGVCTTLTPFESLKEYTPKSALFEPLKLTALFDDESISDGKFAVCDPCAYILSMGHKPPGILPILDRDSPYELLRLTFLEKFALSPKRNFFVHVIVRCDVIARPHFVIRVYPSSDPVNSEKKIPLSPEELAERISFEFVGRFGVPLYQCGQFKISSVSLSDAIRVMVKARPELEKDVNRSVLSQYQEEHTVPVLIRDMLRTKSSAPGFASANLTLLRSSAKIRNPEEVCPYLFHHTHYNVSTGDSRTLLRHSQRSMKTYSYDCDKDYVYICIMEYTLRQVQIQERFVDGRISDWYPPIEDDLNIFASAVRVLGSISGGLHVADAMKPLLRAHVSAFGSPSFAILLDVNSSWDRVSSYPARSPARTLARIVGQTAPNPFWMGSKSFVEDYLSFLATIQSFCRHILGWNYETGKGDGLFGEIDSYFARIAVDAHDRNCVVIAVWKSTPYPALTIQETRLASNIVKVDDQSSDTFSSKLGPPRVNDTISSVLEGIRHRLFFFDQSTDANKGPVTALVKMCCHSGFQDDDLRRVIAAQTRLLAERGNRSVKDVIGRSVETVLSSARLSVMECTASLLGKPPFLSSHDFVNFPLEHIRSWLDGQYDPTDPSSVLQITDGLPPPLKEYADRLEDVFAKHSFFSFYMETVFFDDIVWSPLEREERCSLPLINTSVGRLDAKSVHDALLLLILFKPWRKLSDVLYADTNILSSLSLLYLTGAGVSRRIDGLMKMHSLNL